MLEGNLSCEEMREIRIWDGKVEVTHDGVGHHPGTGKLMRESCIGTCESC